MPPSQNTSSRFIAIETLCRLADTREPVNKILGAILAGKPLSPLDLQLTNNIIFGILRNRESIDTMLQQLCSKPLKKFNPFVLEALRVGIFQIMYLDRIPDSAAVNESVKAVQAARLPKRLHGFVNAVLRNSIRKREELLRLTDRPDRPIHNHPTWLIERWTKQFGEREATRICRENNQQAPLCLQINTCVTTSEAYEKLLQEKSIAHRRGKYCQGSIILEEFSTKVTDLPGYRQGCFQIQDQGAQLLTRLMPAMTPGAAYLDACAGVGGKTSALVQHAHAVRARVSAVEPDGGRRKTFLENMARLHPEHVIPLHPETLQDFAAAGSEQFDAIFLDAPCSGTGVIRRHPDIRWNRQPDDLHRYRKTQLELLHSAATLLKAHGSIVYATCSLEEIENQQVIRDFLAADKDFILEDCAGSLPRTAHPLIEQHCFAPRPEPEMDGFFGARLTKTV